MEPDFDCRNLQFACAIPINWPKSLGSYGSSGLSKPLARFCPSTLVVASVCDLSVQPARIPGKCCIWDFIDAGLSDFCVKPSSLYTLDVTSMISKAWSLRYALMRAQLGLEETVTHLTSSTGSLSDAIAKGLEVYRKELTQTIFFTGKQALLEDYRGKIVKIS